MYERLKALYTDGKITDVHLDNAIAKGWITLEQKQEIMAVEE